MKLAIWDAPMAEAAVSGLAGAEGPPGGVEIQRRRPEACAAALLKGQADVALVPTTMALQGAEGFELIPDAALSSWAYPFARIVLKGDFGADLTGDALVLAGDRRAVQERFVATVVLREHYQLDVEQVLYDGASPKELLSGDEGAALVTATDDLDALPDPGRLRGGGLVMDLGQEWFELAKYPMVWGLFAARSGTLDPETTAALQRGLHAAEERRPEWVRQAEHPLLEAFFADELRLRYDDLVLASLTELKHYLFYTDELSHIPDFSFASLPEEEGEKESR